MASNMPDHKRQDGAWWRWNNRYAHTRQQNASRRFLTLPEGEEDDRLDHQELEHGAVRAQQLPGGEVKEEEGVQRQADGDVVDDGHVQVTAGNTVNREEGDVRDL